jgi:hypothetical protein
VQGPSILHRESGRRIWFNQANVYHRSLSAESLHEGRAPFAAALASLEFAVHVSRGRIRYPYDVRFGDGGTISREAMMAIRAVIWRHTRSFAWEKGDLLILDNERVGHGRKPFRGARAVGVVLLDAMEQIARANEEPWRSADHVVERSSQATR